jgi:hypothetical protein
MQEGSTGLDRPSNSQTQKLLHLETAMFQPNVSTVDARVDFALYAISSCAFPACAQKTGGSA